MNWGQQIKFVDANGKIHVGTVVANPGNNQWGVSHYMNPDHTTMPEFFVAFHQGQWRVIPGGAAGTAPGKAGVRAEGNTAQFYYTNPALAQRGAYAPAPVPTAGQPVGLGQLIYREQFSKMAGGVVKK